MRKISCRLLFACFLVLVGCGGEGSSLSVRDARKYVGAQVSVEFLRQTKPVDWGKVGRQVERTMSLVRAVDAVYETTYAMDIADALDRCKRGESPMVYQQMISKGLQHVSILAMRTQFEELLHSGSKNPVKIVSILFEGIRTTLMRRDEYFFGGSYLEASGDMLLDQLQCGDDSALADDVRLLDKLIDYAYALSVYYELEGIVKNVGIDEALCEKKQMEARLYFRVVEPRMMRSDPAAAEVIRTMIEGPWSAVELSTARKAFSVSFEASYFQQER